MRRSKRHSQGSRLHKKEGPVPFGAEPNASNLQRFHCSFHNVSVAPFTVFALRRLKHDFTLLQPQNYSY